MKKTDPMIEIAFEYISGLKNKSAKFSQIWNKVSKVKGFTPAEEENNISILHMLINQDSRFMLSPKNGNWARRVDFKYSEYKKSTTKTSRVFELLNLDEAEEFVSDEEERKDFENITDENN